MTMSVCLCCAVAMVVARMSGICRWFLWQQRQQPHVHLLNKEVKGVVMHLVRWGIVLYVVTGWIANLYLHR